MVLTRGSGGVAPLLAAVERVADNTARTTAPHGRIRISRSAWVSPNVNIPMPRGPPLGAF